jgi:hypothetical protein
LRTTVLLFTVSKKPLEHRGRANSPAGHRLEEDIAGDIAGDSLVLGEDIAVDRRRNTVGSTSW